MKPDACLVLVLPKSLEDEVVDHLLQHPEWVTTFIALPVAGHGLPQRIASAAEQVRGHAQRVRIELPLRAADAAQLIAHLREDLAGSELDWWLTPLLDAGSFSA